MDEECNSATGSEQSLLTRQSDSKIIGEKRISTNLEEKHELPRKRVKRRDLESVIHLADNKENSVQCSIGDKDISQMDMGASQEVETGRSTFSAEVNVAPVQLDLNSEACCARYSSLEKSGGCVENVSKVPLSEKQEREQCSNFLNSRGINLDLNAEDVSSSINVDPAVSHGRHGHFKTKDVSESGSCSGPLEEIDPMRKWNEFKQNGFFSTYHGGIPVPKQRGRKSKNEMLKKKMELAKREQVNRFTKIAAPSGLLNELNPGIINHVRNRKQVHSIIEALVRSEQQENSSLGSKNVANRMHGSVEISKRDIEYKTDAGKHQLTFPHEDRALHGSSGSRQTRKYPVPMKGSSWVLESKVCNRDACIVEKANHKNCVKEDDSLALKLSSSAKASMSHTTLSNEESSNITTVSSLSLKAATVASQWLDLMHQDLKGRLSALRRSRRRVRSVITTELPFLMSKEFALNQESDSHAMKMSSEISTSKTADLHRERWTALFNHMDEALSEEEKQLESWLNQVKEKQLLCDQGLQHVNWSMTFGLQQLGTSENNSRVSGLDSSEKELAVNAAAASIYSTCNFLLSGS